MCGQEVEVLLELAWQTVQHLAFGGSPGGEAKEIETPRIPSDLVSQGLVKPNPHGQLLLTFGSHAGRSCLLTPRSPWNA